MAQIGRLPEIESYGMDWADVYFGLRGSRSAAELAGVPAERLAAHQRVQGQVSTLRWQKTRWCLVRVPGSDMAAQAGLDLPALEEMFFAACLRDWEADARRWRAIAGQLAQGGTMRLLANETDLTFSIAGRKWMVGDGHINLPDGEIATAPVTESVDGQIYFEWPAVFGGRLVTDIRLAWEHGRLVRATAGQNEAYLRQVLATDDGASRIGEFAFGTNDAMTRPCRDSLLDEKIGGTVHLALGRAYPECGGDNRSAIHWDIVKDTRSEGALFLDGRPIFEGGRFLFQEE